MEKRLMGNVLRAWFWTAKVLRLERLEKRVEELQQSHTALKRVYSISKQQFTPEQQEYRADRAQFDCEACAKTLGISRRCMSPGATTEDMESHNYGHAIVVGEDSVKFCLRCHGDEERGEPSPRMCGFKAALSACP